MHNKTMRCLIIFLVICNCWLIKSASEMGKLFNEILNLV